MRILILMLALLLCIPTAVAEEGDFIPNSRNLPAELIEIPEAYFQPCDTPGTMVRLGLRYLGILLLREQNLPAAQDSLGLSALWLLRGCAVQHHVLHARRLVE